MSESKKEKREKKTISEQRKEGEEMRKQWTDIYGSKSSELKNKLVDNKTLNEDHLC